MSDLPRSSAILTDSAGYSMHGVLLTAELATLNETFFFLGKRPGLECVECRLYATIHPMSASALLQRH